jgi:hypothetical protein
MFIHEDLLLETGHARELYHGHAVGMVKEHLQPKREPIFRILA